MANVATLAPFPARRSMFPLARILLFSGSCTTVERAVPFPMSGLFTGFDNLLGQDDKGDVSTETTGPAQADISAGIQISVERLALLLAYP
ncbi:hypothetical protein V6N13_059266 [Hibiscus sabdariffa]